MFYAKKNKDWEKQAECLHALAVNTRNMEEYDLASLMCEEEITFRLTHFPDDYCGLARSYHEAATLSLLQRNPMKGKINLTRQNNMPISREMKNAKPASCAASAIITSPSMNCKAPGIPIWKAMPYT